MLAAAMLTLAPPLVFGARWPDYSAVRDFISELGARGAPDAAAVNLSFAAGGLAVLWACAVLARSRPALRGAMWLVAAIGGSYVVAAVAPCDAGCPAEGSSTQALHNAVGALAYVTGGIGLLRAGAALKGRGTAGLAWAARLAGIVAIGGVVAMAAPELSALRGLTQRTIELAVFGWLMAAAWPRPSLAAPPRSMAPAPG